MVIAGNDGKEISCRWFNLFTFVYDYYTFSEYFSDLLEYSEEENNKLSKISNESSVAFDDLFGSSSDEIYDESYGENDIIPAIPDPTMAVFFARKVTSSSVIEETITESNIVEKVRITPKIDESNEDEEADDKNKCVCGKGPIPNITLTRGKRKAEEQF